jgi:hypothetical protein
MSPVRDRGFKRLSVSHQVLPHSCSQWWSSLSLCNDNRQVAIAPSTRTEIFIRKKLNSTTTMTNRDRIEWGLVYDLPVHRSGLRASQSCQLHCQTTNSAEHFNPKQNASENSTDFHNRSFPRGQIHRQRVLHHKHARSQNSIAYLNLLAITDPSFIHSKGPIHLQHDSPPRILPEFHKGQDPRGFWQLIPLLVKQLVADRSSKLQELHSAPSPPPEAQP